MKNYICKIIVMFSVLLSSTYGHAGLEMTSTNSIDLGMIYNEHRSMNEFHFVNNGEDDIKIVDMIVTCPCITAVKDRDIIKPNDKFTLRVHFNAGTVHGKFARGVWLITNDKKLGKTLLKVTGEVLPLFKGVPDSEIVLQASDVNIVFTNSFTFEGTTTNYTLARPGTNPINKDISVLWSNDEKQTNVWHLITLTKPSTDARRTISLNIPVQGPAEIENLSIRFKILIGQPLKISPTQLVITEPKKPLSKQFLIYTQSSDTAPDALTYKPVIDGLSISTELYTSKYSLNRKKSKTIKKMNTKYACTISLTPEAIDTLLKMNPPEIIFEYPNHKPAQLPLATLTPSTESPPVLP